MRKSTPSFVLTLQLRATQKHERILFSRLKVGTHIYNQLLRETLKRRNILVQNKEYQRLINLYKQEKDKDKKKLISKDIKAIQEKLQFTEFSLNNFSAKFTTPFKNTIGSQVAQKLAKRAFNAVSQYHFKIRGKPRFKRIRSLENTTNQCNLRFKNNTLIWGKLKIPAIINHNDSYVKHALSQRWHICECGVEAQRDLLAAYLSRFVERFEVEDKIGYKLDIDSAREGWVNGDAILQQAISNVQQLANSGNRVPRSFGINRRRSESSVKLLNKKNAATVNNYVAVGESSSFNK